MERRRARELGPPPVPRFFAGDPSPEDADLELAHEASDGSTRAEEWSSAGTAPDGLGVSSDEGNDVRHEDGAWSETEPVEPSSGRPEGLDGHHARDRQDSSSAPATVVEPADGLEPADHREPADSEDGADPFVEGSHAEARPDAADGDGASAAVEAPERPAEPPRDDESGQTLPFWAVPQSDEPRRRLRIPRLRRPTLRRPRLRRPTRAELLRALPIVLLVIGGLLLLEGAVTVIWKEPFSAITAGQNQSKLGGELKALERNDAAEARSKAESTRYIRRRAVKLNRPGNVGKPLGRLRIKRIGINMVVVQGTDENSLTKGPAHYTQTPLPGTKGNWTVGIAGHRTTYLAPFRHIDSLKKGDQIVFTLPYGRFTYTVERHRIVDAANTSVFVPKGYNRIALTACHPLYSAAQRYIVFGRLTKTEPRGAARRVAERSAARPPAAAAGSAARPGAPKGRR